MVARLFTGQLLCLQELNANIAIAMDLTCNPALKIRASARDLRGDFFGASQDYQLLKNYGHDCEQVAALTIYDNVPACLQLALWL